MFGGFLAWGYAGQSASDPSLQRAVTSALTGAPAQTIPAVYRDESAEAPQPSIAPVTESTSGGLTVGRARKIAADFSSGSLGAVHVVDTDSGQAIVAITKQRQAGSAAFVILEKRGGKYRISSKGRLDIQGFRRATWTSELIDADDDGYQDVLFVGKDSENRMKRHLVLHVPNENRTYSMIMTGETTASGTPRILWLPNAAGTDAAIYRTALRKKARELINASRKR
jgi:hypothetical protein